MIRPRHSAVRTTRLRPKKSLGQNFLRDENICRNIIALIQPNPTDVIVEIGPGEGALTKYLSPSVKKLILVDLDSRVIELMNEQFPGCMVVHRDILEMNLDALSIECGAKLRVVGNIPYNITTPIIFHILDQRSSVKDMVIMLQREVARRLIAAPRTKDYGILAVMCQMFADVSHGFDVPPTAFRPKPSVTSSLIRMEILSAPRHHLADEAFFRGMVRSVFGKRRKTLRKSLQYFIDHPGLLQPEPLDLQRRPEDLSIGELAGLSNELYTRTSRRDSFQTVPIQE